MRSAKKLSILLLLLTVVFCLSSCKESDESKYGKAKEMVAGGQYAEAVAKFEELADYEQTAQYVSYCNAILAGESGEYRKAADALAVLSGFEDSATYMRYYETKIAENEIKADISESWMDCLSAAEAYDTLGTFRDSREHADKLRKAVYDLAVSEAADLDYESAITKLDALNGYSDSSALIDRYRDMQTYAYTVTALRWERRIAIEENVAYPESGWELPENGELTDQKEEVHHYERTVDHYETASVVRTKKVLDHYESYPTCVDRGGGVYGEVDYKWPVYRTGKYTDTVMAPVYNQTPVYQTKYYYNVRRWTETRDVDGSGEGHSAEWPETGLTEYERECGRTEAYYFTVKRADGPERTFCVSESIWNSIEQDGTVYFTVVKSKNEEYLSTKAGEKITDLQEIN